MSLSRTQIKTHLADAGLRMGAEDGERTLEEHDPASGWKVRARGVKNWLLALRVAVTMGLCAPLPGTFEGDQSRPAPAPEYRPTDELKIKVSDADGDREVAIHLLAYQRAAIEDHHRIVILCWCRQAGKDFTTSLKAVLDAMETGQNWYIVSLTQRQALATAKKAQMHARAIGGVLPKITAQEHTYQGRDGQAFTITSYGVKLKNGAEIVALPGKDPDALAGLTGNVIFTEMALFPNNGKDHWRVVFPLATRGFKVWAISTPRGPETKFSELRRNAAEKYSVHNVTIYDAVAGGLVLKDDRGQPITPQELETIYADPEGWSREYMCVEGEDHQPLIGWQWINACGSDEPVQIREVKGRPGMPRHQLTEQFDEGPGNRFFADLRKAMSGRPVLGYDVAVTGDLATLPYGEVLGDVTALRALVVMQGVDDFDYQERVVCQAMDTGAVGVGDASGLGRDICQRLEKRYGDTRFKGLVFSAQTKTALFTQLRDEMNAVHLRIPRHNEIIRYDLYALARMEVGVAGRLQVLTLRNALLQASHADIATGIALMVDAAQGDGGAVFAESAGRPAGRERLGADFGRPDHSDDYAANGTEGWGY